ncbi:nucleotide exchange factor GrpE [Tepidamorphus sp. 3E244]|uniref:nucleotide exchange factor GrpE n=1 Tax=Tepidamorphus sp. 3E244 TaxID=3385498 RepID=UPI0038FC9152
MSNDDMDNQPVNENDETMAADGPDMEAAQAAAAALAAENAEMKDRLLRTVAEMENLRKRTDRQVREAGQYAIANFARDMLVVADNLSRALETGTPEEAEAMRAAFDSMREGVQLTKGELVRLMERHGVKKIAAEGEKFDPNMHQAIFEVPDPSVPSGTVMQVTQDGYSIGERVLRPAMVGVSKGGPKSAPKPQEAPAAEAETQPETGGEAPGSEEHVDKTV